MISLDDLLYTADMAVTNLVRLATPTGWSAQTVPGLTWNSREVVDHLANTLAFYANHAASRAQDHQPRIRSLGEANLADRDLAKTLRAWAAVLSSVVSAAPDNMRAWHPLGMVDREGFLALACDELLIHTYDVVRAHHQMLDPAPALADRLLIRLFPQADRPVLPETPWEVLLWANGRSATSRRPALNSWHPHPEPL